MNGRFLHLASEGAVAAKQGFARQADPFRTAGHLGGDMGRRTRQLPPQLFFQPAQEGFLPGHDHRFHQAPAAAGPGRPVRALVQQGVQPGGQDAGIPGRPHGPQPGQRIAGHRTLHLRHQRAVGQGQVELGLGLQPDAIHRDPGIVGKVSTPGLQQASAGGVGHAAPAGQRNQEGRQGGGSVRGAHHAPPRARRYAD